LAENKLVDASKDFGQWIGFCSIEATLFVKLGERFPPDLEFEAGKSDRYSCHQISGDIGSCADQEAGKADQLIELDRHGCSSNVVAESLDLTLRSGCALHCVIISHDSSRQ
jgi:hypothetical protein